MEVLSRQEAMERNHAFKQHAIEVTYQSLRTQTRIPQEVVAVIRIDGIDEAALAQAEAWPTSRHLGVRWNWRGLMYRIRKNARGFHLAVWHDQMLCGMALGRVSRGKMHLKISNIQAFPDAHPLEGHIVYLVLDVAENYAVQMGCAELSIENPLEALIPYYESFPDFYRTGGENKWRPVRIAKRLVLDGDI